ncbi:MAG: hypothetical protein AAB368_06455 [bacterium]
MERVRCKFRCVEHKEFAGWQKILHQVAFVPVGGDGSPENKAFYDATPGGRLEIATITRMPFTIGHEYYLDLTEALEG